jgi:hypothetical protein
MLTLAFLLQTLKHLLLQQNGDLLPTLLLFVQECVGSVANFPQLLRTIGKVLHTHVKYIILGYSVATIRCHSKGDETVG